MSDNNSVDDSDESAESVFTISYTSGTSGNSKGVVLTNANFLAAIVTINTIAEQLNFDQDDVYLSYLPLAHVFDRLGVHTLLSCGGQIGFFGGEILKVVEDL